MKLDTISRDPALGQELLKTMPQGVSIVDEDGRLLFANPAMVELFGAPRLGQTCWSVYRDDQEQCPDCPLRRPIQVGVTETIESHGVLGGRTFRITHTGMVLAGRKVLVEVFHDMSEIHAGQRRVRELEKTQALAAERSRISRDMHDHLGSTLTHIKLLGEVLELDAKQPDKVADHARLVSAKARQLADEMDEIVWATNPQKDHLENLASYLGRYATQFIGLTDLHCRLAIPAILPEIALSSPVRHRLFLAVKEALNNVVKHAAAQEVRLSLAVADGRLSIEVRDDGVGFAPGRVTGERNGLANMVAGLAEIGGTCEIHSSLGEGARVQLTILIGDDGDGVGVADEA